MRSLKFLALLILPLLAFTNAHKYYMSVTDIDYVKEKKSVQISSRIFIDDFESLLRARYDETIMLADKNEQNTTDIYIERYLKEKINIKINGKEASFNYIGKEYDVDVMTCYLEIVDIKFISSFEIINTVFFDLFKDQQNIIKTNINDQKKSYILIAQKGNVLLNFN